MDLRFAVRLFARQPAFALTAIVTLALGIGANTAIFTAVDGILLRPLPYQDSPRLTMLWMRYSMMDVAFRPSVYLPLAERTNSFDPMAAFQYESFNLTGDPNPERIQGITATAGIFPLLGVAPEIGRSFAASEERDRVAILSHELWQRRFAGDSGILGRAISLNGSPYTVIGVLPRGFDMVAGGDMPRGFRFAAHTDVWVPLPLDRASGRLYLFALGKLRPGVTLAAAQAELTALTQSIRGDQSQEPDLDARAVPLQQQVTGRIRPTLSWFMGAVAVVLLIVCANVANLLIARAPLRQREIAVRAAMGAGAGRILRQLMTESLLLGAAGGALGCLAGWWGATLLRRFAPEDVPRFYARLDLRVAAFFVAISALASLLFGVLPAVRLARIDLHTALKTTGGRIVGGRSRLGSTLAIAELALSLVLLSGAGLLVRSFARLLDTDPGFRADRVLTAQLALPEARYPHIREMSGLIDRAVENISRAPGIEAAGAASVIPMGGIDRDFPELQIEGRAPFRQDEIGVIGNSWTSGDFFRVLRIPLVGGRYFDAGDRTDSPRVAILNEGLSRRIFGHADPVGRNLIFSFLPDKPRVRIVGVVGDVKQAGLDLEAPRRLYLPASQVPIPSVTFLLRHDAGGSHRGRSHARGRRSARGGTGGGSGSAGFEFSHHAIAGRGIAGGPPIRHDAARFVRGACRGARRWRLVRRDRVHGFRAHRRNRGEDGARRPACGCFKDDPA